MNNKISDERIFEILNHYSSLIKKDYDEKYLLGLFVYGKANYGFAETEDDIEIEAMFLPTFEQLCLNDCIKDEHRTYEDKDIYITDFRTMIKRISEINHEHEALYTKYYLVNPRYEHLYKKYLRNNREKIVYKNKKQKMKSVAEIVLNDLYVYDTMGFNQNLIFEIFRLYYSATLYKENKPFLKCMNFIEEIPLAKIIMNKIGDKEDPLIKEMLPVIKSFFIKIVDSEDGIVEKEEPNYIKDSILEIIKLSLNNNSNELDFIKRLTDMEKIALKSIYERIGDEGNITISKLVNETSISRPVFNNLFFKMRDTGVAEVTNMGGKGMFIKILNPEILTLNNKEIL